MKKVNCICIIDDDAIYTLLLKKMIVKLDICDTVVSYANGEEAYLGFEKNIQQNNPLPNIVLLDINMPIMDGWEFMDAFLALKPQIQQKIAIYIASSSITIEDREKAASYADIVEYLNKPVVTATLQKIIQEQTLD